MRKPFKLAISVAFGFISTTLVAQITPLDDCIKIALENNIQVKNSHLDLASTAFQIKEVKSALLPTINANASYMYYTELPAQYVSAPAFGGADGEYKKLTLNMPQTTSANIQVSTNLFNQAVLTGLQAARTAQSASSLQLVQTKENVIYNVTSTYYSIQVLNDNLSRIADNIQNLEKSVRINEVLKNNEIVPASVHNRLLVNLENLRNQYENQKLVQTTNVTLLKYLMNVPLTEPLEVEPLQYDELIADVSAGDINNRVDIQLQKEQVKLMRLDKKTVVAGFYPTLTSNMYFGYTGFNDEFAPMQRINNDWINSSYYSLALRIPIFDGFEKKYKIKQKEVAIQKDINKLSMMSSNAEKEIADAVNSYVTNKNLLINNKKSMELAEQLFNTSQTEYNNGITSITDLLNVQNDLSNARNNYSSALINLKQAELSLKKANGELLNN
jgi:outer membrane protein